jgi:hypothetical protein
MAFAVKKRKPMEFKDEFFIHAGRWFQKFSDAQYVGARLVIDISQIPEEYLKAWADWKPSPPNREKLGLGSYSTRTGKLF